MGAKLMRFTVPPCVVKLLAASVNSRPPANVSFEEGESVRVSANRTSGSVVSVSCGDALEVKGITGATVGSPVVVVTSPGSVTGVTPVPSPRCSTRLPPRSSPISVRAPCASYRPKTLSGRNRY